MVTHTSHEGEGEGEEQARRHYGVSFLKMRFPMDDMRKRSSCLTSVEIYLPHTPQACSFTRYSSSMLSPNASTASTSGTIRMGVATPHKGVRCSSNTCIGGVSFLGVVGGFTYIHAGSAELQLREHFTVAALAIALALASRSKMSEYLF